MSQSESVHLFLCWVENERIRDFGPVIVQGDAWGGDNSSEFQIKTLYLAPIGAQGMLMSVSVSVEDGNKPMMH